MLPPGNSSTDCASSTLAGEFFVPGWFVHLVGISGRIEAAGQQKAEEYEGEAALEDIARATWRAYHRRIVLAHIRGRISTADKIRPDEYRGDGEALVALRALQASKRH